MRILLCLSLLVFPALAQTFVVRQATVVDGTGAPARTADVYVRDGKIAAVGDGLEVPDYTPGIDGRGKTLMPGLFDLHTHLLASAVPGASNDWPATLRAYLISGVTTVVDLSTYPEQFEPMRSLINSGLPAPRLMLAARFSTPGGHGLEGGRGDFHTQSVVTPREARAAVRRILPYRPDVLKVFTDGWRYGMDTDMTSMDEETLKALVEEAHAGGVKVLTHTVTLDKAKLAARAGVDIIIHGIGDAKADAELLSLMKEKKTGYVSTLAVYEPRQARDPRSSFLESLLAPAAYTRIRPASGEPEPARIKRWENLTHNVRAAAEAGVANGCGTDAGMSGAYHGWSTLRELELMVASGIKPLDALTIATGASARLIGATGRGAIEPGKDADLVLVGGLPHETITDIYKIERVWLSGIEQDRSPVGVNRPQQIKPVLLPELLDDFESADGRSRISTLWLNRTDGGHDHSKMLYQRVKRDGGHALAWMAEMGEKDRPLAAMVLPLTKGGVFPADLSQFAFLEFEVRGDGEYRVEIERPGLGPLRSPFTASSEWSKVRIGLSGEDATAFVFVMERPAKGKAWLEMDNLQLLKR